MRAEVDGAEDGVGAAGVAGVAGEVTRETMLEEAGLALASAVKDMMAYVADGKGRLDVDVGVEVKALGCWAELVDRGRWDMLKLVRYF